MADKRDELFDELYRLYGYCGHCGKKECAGKKSNSRLPDKILIDTSWLYAFLEVKQKSKKMGKK
jgi:hypothetical protein